MSDCFKMFLKTETLLWPRSRFTSATQHRQLTCT